MFGSIGLVISGGIQLASLCWDRSDEWWCIIWPGWCTECSDSPGTEITF